MSTVKDGDEHHLGTMVNGVRESSRIERECSRETLTRQAVRGDAGLFLVSQFSVFYEPLPNNGKIGTNYNVFK